MRLPLNFDIHILLNLTFIILNSQHVIGILSAIKFWFKNFPIFETKVKEDFVKVINKIFFYNLFLHWSNNVRELFYHLICYRVLHWYKSTKNRNVGRILASMNTKMSNVQNCGDLYSKEVFKRQQMNKKQRRALKINELQLQVIDKVFGPKLQEQTMHNVIGDKNITLMSKAKYERKNSTDSVISEDDPYIVKFDEASQRIRDYTVLRMNSNKIKRKQLVYCFSAVNEFKRVLMNFNFNYGKFKKDPEGLLPELGIALPIDKTETIEEEEF